MKSIRNSSGGLGLEAVISYLLIAGVIISLVLEVVGTILYYRSYGNLALLFNRSNVMINGHDFFSFIYSLFFGNGNQGAAIWFMTAGIALLILTPFIKVVVSVLYFGWEKNFKYLVITLFVLTILTLSLSLH